MDMIRLCVFHIKTKKKVIGLNKAEYFSYPRTTNNHRTSSIRAPRHLKSRLMLYLFKGTLSKKKKVDLSKIFSKYSSMALRRINKKIKDKTIRSIITQPKFSEKAIHGTSF